MTQIDSSSLTTLRSLAEDLDFHKLVDCLDELESSDHLSEAERVELLPLQALGYLQTGDAEKGRDFYQQAQTNFNELSLEAKIDLAGVALLLHQAPKAQTWLEPIVEQFPGQPIALARLGHAYAMQNEFEAAKPLFEQSLALAPERITTRSTYLAVLLSLKDIEAATSQLQRLREQINSLKEDTSLRLVSTFTPIVNEHQLRLWVLTQDFAEAENWIAEMLPESSESVAKSDTAEKEKNKTQRQPLAPYFQAVSLYVRLLAENDLHSQATHFLGETIRDYKSHEESLPLKLQFAELAQLQGNQMQAVAMMRQAITQSPENIDLWCQLAKLQTHSSEKAGLNAAEKAVELFNAQCEAGEWSAEQQRNYTLKVKTTLASAKSQAQDFATAESLFDEVLTIEPDFVPALTALGQQKLQTGDIETTVELFERVKKIDPVSGLSALINARQYPEDEATLSKMEKAAYRPSLAGEVKSSLLFQLAAAWEKHKDYDKAFELAKQANDASRQFLQYDPKQHRNECARVRFAFSQSLYQHRPNYGLDSDLPVFVLGMPRSGTTLVEQILAGHSQIFGAGELGVIPQRIQGLQRWERHVGSGRRYPDCVDDLTEEVAKGIAQGILDELEALKAEDKPAANFVVDKLPHNFENIGLIKFFFPNARIISVRRDPRDIAISNYFTDYAAKHGGMGFAYDLTWIGEQLADHNLMMHHWHQVFPNEILEINYEDVVDDLEGSARKMLQYIGVDWESQVLDFNKVDRPVKTASVWQVRQPLYKTSKEKWRRYESYLAPLIKGTNAKIQPDPIDDMITLPEAGFLTDGVALFNDGQLDEAEYSFKKMLHHNPEHAAANYMVGLVYFRKGHFKEGIELVEKALEVCPWHRDWKESLLEAYKVTGQQDKVDQLAKALNLSQDDFNEQATEEHYFTQATMTQAPY